MAKKFPAVVTPERMSAISALYKEDAQSDTLRLVPVDHIRPNPHQPRHVATDLAELTESIRDRGILQPLIGRPDPEGGYTLIAGHRRLEAAKRAGLEAVPLVEREGVGDEDLRVLALIENIQRENFHPVDEVRALAELVASCGTQDKAAETLRIGRSTLAGRLRALALGEAVLDLCTKVPDLTHNQLRQLRDLPEHRRERWVRALIDPPASGGPQQPVPVRTNLFTYEGRTGSKGVFKVQVRFRKRDVTFEELVEALEQYLATLKKDNV